MYSKLNRKSLKNLNQRHDAAFKLSARNKRSLKVMVKKVLPRSLWNQIDWDADIFFPPLETTSGKKLRRSVPDGAVVFTLKDGTCLLVVFEHMSHPFVRAEWEPLTDAINIVDQLVKKGGEYEGKALRIVVVLVLQGPAAERPPRSIADMRGNPTKLSNVECELGPVVHLDLRTISLKDLGPDPYKEALPMAMGFWKKKTVTRKQLDCAFRAERRAYEEGDIELSTCILSCIETAELRERTVRASASRFNEADRVEEIMASLAEQWVEDGFTQGRNKGRNEGRIEGRNEGRIEGRNEGRIEGRNEGRNEGRIEGRNEGRNEGWVDAVMAVFKERFGVVPRSLKKRLQAASADELGGWMRRAATAPSVDKALNGERPGKKGSSG